MRPLTAVSDRSRTVPASPTARRDDIAAALRSLREEHRRLERLGLELPLARCHHETRYWTFLDALFTASVAPANGRRGDLPWPDARD